MPVAQHGSGEIEIIIPPVSEIEGDLSYQDTFWDDLRFPATAVNPPGGVNDADVDPDDGTFLFNKSATEVVCFIAQMPHSWKEGTAIHPHVHWSKTTSAGGNVLFRLETDVASIGGQFAGTWTTHGDILITENPDVNTADKHLISEFLPIDMTGHKISAMMRIRLSRIGGDALDTYDADARLYEFDIHYEIDSPGSRDELTK